MDQPGHGELADASLDSGSAHCTLGVPVYDADGEQFGTVSDWQNLHNFLIVHKGQLVGHDTYIPHGAIEYSDMDGVHLRVRWSDVQGNLRGDLTSMTQPLLPQQVTPQSLPISLALPILVPDTGAASVAAIAFANHATSRPALSSIASMRSAVEATQDHTMPAGTETDQSVEQAIGQGSGQTTGVGREQVGALPERVQSRHWWQRSN